MRPCVPLSPGVKPFIPAIRVSSHSSNLSRPRAFMLAELKAFLHELRPENIHPQVGYERLIR
jgi:hypothetical protein